MNKRGRPKLSSDGSDPVKVSYYFTEDLLKKIKSRSHDLGVKDSTLIRNVLEEFLNIYKADKEPDRIVFDLGDGSQISAAVRKAAEMRGVSPEALFRTALVRGLSEISKETNELNKIIE